MLLPLGGDTVNPIHDGFMLRLLGVDDTTSAHHLYDTTCAHVLNDDNQLMMKFMLLLLGGDITHQVYDGFYVVTARWG